VEAVPQVQSGPQEQFGPHVQLGLPQPDVGASVVVVPHVQVGPQVQLSPHVQLGFPQLDADFSESDMSHLVGSLTRGSPRAGQPEATPPRFFAKPGICRTSPPCGAGATARTLGWMRLPIVDNAERPVQLDWLRISRVQSPTLVHARLEVRVDEDAPTQLRASTAEEPRDGDFVELDAQLAGELVSAVRLLVELGPYEPDTPFDAEGLRHEVEVSWDGVVHRYELDGEPGDDALHGVLRLVSHLLGTREHITSVAPGDHDAQVRDVAERLRLTGSVFAEDEARLLLDAASSPHELATMIDARSAGTPIAVVVGWTEFHGLRVEVDRGVFVPRPRTEHLVDVAVALGRELDHPPVVVDLCCGTGALGLATSHLLDPPVELHATDIDEVAAACASRNLLGRGTVYQGDLFEPLPQDLRGHVDLLLANTPYVPTADIASPRALHSLGEYPRVARRATS